MRRRIIIALAGLALTAGVSAAVAQVTGSGELRLTRAEVASQAAVAPGAGTSGIAAIRMTVLYGDPNVAGPYTIALDVPPNTSIKAHTHKDARTAVVVRGIWNFGYGTTATDAATKRLDPGSFYSEPASVAHFARTGPEGATVYITGMGPSDTVYTETEAH